jgi:thiol-disulfide isomerase/thioredoxin
MNKNTVLYFYASWCGYCNEFRKKEMPKLKNFGLSYSNGNDEVETNFEFYDVDTNRDIYNQWKKNDRGVPLFIFLGPDGKEYLRKTGYISASEISNFLQNSP